MKKILATMLVMVMVFSMTACGAISDDKILGDWTTETLNGQAIPDASQAVNVNIEKDGKVTFTSALGTQEYTYEKRTDGIEIKEKGKDEIAFSMSYDDANSKFSYKINVAGTEYTYVLKKGTTDLSAAAAAPATDAAQ